jgi:hypothetical protein
VNHLRVELSASSVSESSGRPARRDPFRWYAAQVLIPATVDISLSRSPDLGV